MEKKTTASNGNHPSRLLKGVNWFLKAKYGLYKTYQHNGADWVPSQGYPYTCRPDGTLSDNDPPET